MHDIHHTKEKMHLDTKAGDQVGIDFPSCSDAGDPSHFFYCAALKRGFGKANIAPVCTI